MGRTTATTGVKLGETEMAPVADRLSALFAEQGADASDTRRDGPPSATWCIGETLGACGGYDLMWLVYRMFEERHGLAAGRWLDRSWDGINIERVVRWKTDDGPYPSK